MYTYLSSITGVARRYHTVWAVDARIGAVTRQTVTGVWCVMNQSATKPTQTHQLERDCNIRVHVYVQWHMPKASHVEGESTKSLDVFSSVFCCQWSQTVHRPRKKAHRLLFLEIAAVLFWVSEGLMVGRVNSLCVLLLYATVSGG